jgi:hypothetical protein
VQEKHFKLLLGLTPCTLAEDPEFEEFCKEEVLQKALKGPSRTKAHTNIGQTVLRELWMRQLRLRQELRFSELALKMSLI